MAFEINARKEGEEDDRNGDSGVERSYIDALLDCSDRIESFVNTVSCDDWAEAATGWKATIPNPKFIPQKRPADPPTKKRKDDEHRSPYEDAPFRNRPDTHYRYTTKTKSQPKSLKQISEISVPKKPPDVGLQDHINKVKEHLEVALRTKEPYDDTGMKKQLNDKFVHEFLENLTEQLKTEADSKLTAGQNTQGGSDGEKVGETDDTPYRVTMVTTSATNVADGKDKTGQQVGESRKMDYKSEIKLQDSFVRVNKHGTETPKHDLELIVENTRTQSLNDFCGRHRPVVKNEKQMNLLDRINKKLDETLAEQDQYSVSLKRKTNNPHGVEKLSSRSYEKFPAFTILPAEQADLRPLRKLTPSQRRASDDHDIVTKLGQERDLDGRHQITSAPLLSSTTSISSSFNGERLRSDSPNKNFMTRGINGKSIRVPPTLKSPYAQQSGTKDGKKKKVPTATLR